MSSRKAASKQISYRDESSSEEDSEELDLADKKIVKKGKRSQKKQKEEVEIVSSESEFELDKEKPKGKKGKGKARGGGKKKGKGKEKEIRKNPFDVLPFELFVEILSYLSPKDLLHLARTNKSYRSILFSKQRSESIWKRSLESVGLPIPTAKDWSLPAYADLVFTTHCYECGRYSPTWHDPWLRTRLCKPCRQNSLIKMTFPPRNYHPSIVECVVGSRFTTSDVRYVTRDGSYFLVDKVDEMDARLKELQAEDEEDDSESEPESSSSSVSPTQRRNRSQPAVQRPTRSVRKEKSYREESEEEEETVFKIGPRVQAFVKKREKYVEKVDSVKWTRIRPKILHLVDAAESRKRDKDRETKLVECEVSRKNSLRKFYDKLVEELDEGQWPPLFVDFLFLPSVQLFWRRLSSQDHREKITGMEWIMKRDSVVRDCQEYHVETVEKAVRLILSTTQEYANEDEFDSPVEEVLSGDLDSFFNKPTSFIFCDGGCEIHERLSRSRTWSGRFTGRVVKKKGAATFGTFIDIVNHQLSTHNSFKASNDPSSAEKRQTRPQFRFILPLEVASVVADLVEFTGVAEDSVTVQDLDSLDDGILRWENVTGRRWFRQWRALIIRVYVVARKAARSRPPINLPPPDISWDPPFDWSASITKAHVDASVEPHNERVKHEEEEEPFDDSEEEIENVKLEDEDGEETRDDGEEEDLRTDGEEEDQLDSD